MVAIPRSACAQTVIGILTSVTGRVTVVRPASPAIPLRVRETISVGELITTGEESAAEFLPLGSAATVVRLRERTTLSVDQTPRRTILTLVDGAVAVAGPVAWHPDRRDIFEVRTRHAVAQSRGAAFWVEIGEPSASRVCVFTGTAVVSALGDADGRRVPVGPRQCATVTATDIGALEAMPELSPAAPGSGQPK